MTLSQISVVTLLSLCLLLNPLHVSSEDTTPSEAPVHAHQSPSTNQNTADEASPASTNQNAGSGTSITYLTNPKPANAEVEEITYDQRQNGTQNVRIHLDDVTLIVAPSEGIMSLFAAQQMGGQTLTAQQEAAIAAQYANFSESAHHTSTGQSTAQPAADPYADFDELISSANFLKKSPMSAGQGSGVSQQGGHGAVVKRKKCTGERCQAKR